MLKTMYFFIALIIIAGIVTFLSQKKTTDSLSVVEKTEVEKTETEKNTEPDKKDVSDLIVVSDLEENSIITSPLVVSGNARGNWFFEANFPIELLNGEGAVIATAVATTSAENWMTTEFIPFSATLEFVNPYQEGDPEYWKKGILVLKKDNPSDLPEHDNSLEIPIYFAP